jgi:tyrosine-protein kinase Etk/Wzc
MALLISLLAPFSIVYVRDLLNNKVQSQDDIKSQTDLPILGTLFNNEEVELPVVVNAPASIVAESFRMLRTNMQFLIADDKTPVIAVSSAMKGEGKSYTAINLAAVYASYNKKVCLIDLDLRRPKLAQYLNVDNTKGMSNLLVGQVEVDDITSSVNNGLFDLLPSGPIPPNPSELIASDKLEKLIEKLKEKYDIIIMDSPPIGMVSDAMLLSNLVGYFMLVVRHNVTHKQFISVLVDEMKRNKIKGLSAVYNDVPVGKKGYYKYGTRYGYYYSSSEKSFWQRLFRTS